MKKLLISTMIAMLAFTFVGCGSKNSASSTLINWMKSGTYYMKYTTEMEYQGQKTKMKGSMAVQGDNMAMNAETTSGGYAVKSRVISLGDATYVIDDNSKTMMKTAKNKSVASKGTADFSKIEKIGSGKGTINGRTLPYEEYKSGNYTIKYYMDGKNVYAIESKGEGTRSVMIIEEASKTVPSGSFDLPKGYKSFSF